MPTVSHARAIAAGAALTLCACGGEPTRPRLDPRALHYDSLSRVASASGEITRAAALSQIAFAYAGGVTPASVSVLDSGVATTYRAAVTRTVLTGPPPLPPMGPMPDMWDVVFWQEPDGERFIHVSGRGDSVSFFPEPGGSSPLRLGMLDWGAPGREKRSSLGYALLAVGDSSGSCALTSSTAPCTLMNFTVSVAAVVKPTLWPRGPVVDSAPPHPIAATALVIPGFSLVPRSGLQ